ncbi:MAG: hypothetical protein JKY68_07440 [Rhodospirillales bacterium]|nr:hypothetical protein [Rhodospirillales bacterium]
MTLATGVPPPCANASAPGDGGGWGQAFCDFMVSADAQAIYREHGLKAPQ